MMTPDPGSFFEDEVLTLTGTIERCHFYRCLIIIEGPATITDCTFGDMMEYGDIECHGEVNVSRCLFAGRPTSTEAFIDRLREMGYSE